MSERMVSIHHRLRECSRWFLAIALITVASCDNSGGMECDRLTIRWQHRAEYLSCDTSEEEYSCRQHGMDEDCDDPRIVECEDAIDDSTNCAELRSIAYCLVDCRSGELDFDSD